MGDFMGFHSHGEPQELVSHNSFLTHILWPFFPSPGGGRRLAPGGAALGAAAVQPRAVRGFPRGGFGDIYGNSWKKQLENHGKMMFDKPTNLVNYN